MQFFLLLAVFVYALYASSPSIDFDAFPFQDYLDTDRKFRISWEIDEDDGTITMALSAPTTGWAAVGLSATGQMPLADIMLFWVDDVSSKIFLQDRYTTAARTMPLLDDQQDLVLLAGEQVDGVTNVMFRRSIQPCDAQSGQDYPIVDGTARMLYAMSSDASDPDLSNYDKTADIPAGDITFNFHGQNRGSRSINLLNGLPSNVEMEADALYEDLLMSNYEIPNVKTTYKSSYHTLPVDETEQYHVIKFQVIAQAGNEPYLHHLILYYCSSDEQSAKACSSASFSWAIGGSDLSFPKEIGLPMAQGQLHHVRLEIHYDNPNFKTGVIDNSGVRVWYTKTLRKYDAGMFELGLPVGEYQFVPAGMPYALNTAYCSDGCTGIDGAFPETGVKAFALGLHTHELGRALSLRHFRDGKELPPVTSNFAYDADYQQYTFLAEEVQFLPGDEFMLECYYDSTSRKEMTFGGLGSEEEMCQVYIYVYPKPKLNKCLSFFTGTQKAIFNQLGAQAGYATLNAENDLVEYDVGGGPAKISHPLVGNRTFQNGQEWYDFVWTDFSSALFHDRWMLCTEDDGTKITERYPQQSPILHDYEAFVAEEECDDIEGSVQEIAVEDDTGAASGQSVKAAVAFIFICTLFHIL